MEFSTEYYWVVLCKNQRFHHRQNLYAEHKILLGEADAYSSPPPLPNQFRIKCDDCAEEYAYSPHDVVRAETEPPDLFVAHRLFSEISLAHEEKKA
jgi:hypothetical protein